MFVDCHNAKFTHKLIVANTRIKLPRHLSQAEKAFALRDALPPSP